MSSRPSSLRSTPDLAPDVGRFIAHCRWLVDNHAGLAIFGTNSEAVSLSVDERLALTDALLEAGIPAAKLMPGTGACSITDAVTLTRHAVQHGAAGVLMLPPFYYKGVSDDGVFAYYSEVIERVGDERLAIYLYHFPQTHAGPHHARLDRAASSSAIRRPLLAPRTRRGTGTTRRR